MRQIFAFVRLTLAAPRQRDIFDALFVSREKAQALGGGATLRADDKMWRYVESWPQHEWTDKSAWVWQ